MKRGFYILMLIIGAAVLASSCGKSARTYAEKLKDERKMIRKLMDSLDFVVIDRYPSDGVFKDNEFVQLSSGLYINVVDSGNGNRAVAGYTKIHSRFEFDYMHVLSNTIQTFNGFDNSYPPLTFVYGGLETYGAFLSLYGSGLTEPLAYVGDSAIVKLIVPFKIGGSEQEQGSDPVYYKKLRYIFDK